MSISNKIIKYIKEIILDIKLGGDYTERSVYSPSLRKGDD